VVSATFQIREVPLTFPVKVADEKQESVVIGSVEVMEPETGALTSPPPAP
jgi:hypothetical protein